MKKKTGRTTVKRVRGCEFRALLQSYLKMIENSLISLSVRSEMFAIYLVNVCVHYCQLSYQQISFINQSLRLSPIFDFQVFLCCHVLSSYI